MKKRIKVIFILAFVCMLTSLFYACSSKNNEKPNGEIASITLSKSELSLVYGDSAVLVANSSEQGTVIEWISSNESVITVTNGVVYAVGVGNATVTAKGNNNAVATCKVEVQLGDSQPYLIINNVSECIVLNEGEKYTVDAYVSFNSNTFDCNVTAEIDNEEVVDIDNAVISAKKEGETLVKLSSNWNGFNTPLMSKSFVVKVVKNISLYGEVVIGDGEDAVSSFSNTVDIYSIDCFEGQNYPNSVTINLKTDDEIVESTFEIIKGNEYISLNNNIVTAKDIESDSTSDLYGEGRAELTAKCEVKGVKIEKTFIINVKCPIKQKDSFEWDQSVYTENYNSLFDGQDVCVKYAKQGDRILSCTDTKINGLVFNGKETEPIEIRTNKGGYLFTNLIGYDKLINKENALETLKLRTNNQIKGYYALAEDIGDMENPIDFTSQIAGNDTTNFAGVLDGNGHTIYAKVGDYGVLGRFGNNAVVKDVKFNITFGTDTACGIAGGKGDWTKKLSVSIKNVFIETNNWGEKNHAVCYYKNELMTLKDVLVKVNGVPEDYTYNGQSWEKDGAKFGVGVLFQIDYSQNGQFVLNSNKQFDNVRVIFSKLAPMSDGTAWNAQGQHRAFAKNDEDYFVAKKRVNDYVDGVNYQIVTEVENNPGWRTKIWQGKWVNCLIFYHSSTELKKGGVFRYNTVKDLIDDGIIEVGSWRVE